MKKKIFFEPHGGLGNRMRAIAAAYALAKKFDYQLIVLWKKDKGLNCSYEHLFFNDNNFKVVDVNYHYILLFYKIIIFLLRGKIFKKATWKKHEEYENVLKNGIKRIYIDSFNQFYPPITFSIFKPQTYILQKCQTIIDDIDDHTIGIHVRMTDNKLSMKVSTINLFEEKMDELCINQPEVKFFLSTDSSDTGLYLNNKFPGRITSYKEDKQLNRNTENGIVTALIDMYCLSKCSLILGSYYSSFSEVAAKWGNMSKLVIIGDNQKGTI